MMKKTAKIISFLIAACIAFTTFAGCKKNTDEKGTLYIYAHNSGYGTAYLDKLSAEFTKTYGVKIVINKVTEEGDMFTKLESGVSNADLMFCSTGIFKYLYTPKKIGGKTYDCLLEDLTDIYTSAVPGESVTVEEKMDDEYRSFHAFEKDGKTKYYSMPWIKGINGLLINDFYWENDWSEPRTTDELLDLCAKIKKTGKTPFIYCADDSYWSSGIAPVWAAQYMGEDEVTAYSNGYNKDGTRYLPNMQTSYDGFYQSLKVMEKLLDDDKGYMSVLSKSLDFTSVQNEFLETKNSRTEKIVMIPSGDWIEREMNANYEKDEVDVHFMRLPVISALGEKLGITESELCAIIDYVDGKTTEAPTFASTKDMTSEAVIAAVRDARALTPAYSLTSSACIPAYSNEIENAKKFLQFMATDKGIELFVDGSDGYTLPYDYDYLNSSATKNKFSRLQSDSQKLLADSKAFTFDMKDRIFALGYLVLPGLNENKYYESILSASKASGYFKTAEQIYMSDYQFVQNQWSLIKTNAGIVG